MKPKYYLLTEFGPNKIGSAWVKLAYVPPVIPNGLQSWKISMIIAPLGGKYYHTHSFSIDAQSANDEWTKKSTTIFEQISLGTGANGRFTSSLKTHYENACVLCCEANQWTNGDVSYLFR